MPALENASQGKFQIVQMINSVLFHIADHDDEGKAFGTADRHNVSCLEENYGSLQRTYLVFQEGNLVHGPAAVMKG